MEEELLIQELKKFSSTISTFGGECDAESIGNFERLFNVALPDDYKYIINQINGFDIMGNSVYGINSLFEISLEEVYKREHYEVAYPQPFYLVPFSPDGGGNFYCFDTRFVNKVSRSCPIVFWVSNYEYTDEDQPEIVYPSFIIYVQEVIINWLLEDYDYEGNERDVN